MKVRSSIRYFAARDQDLKFERVFAVSQDSRAVKWQYEKSGWRPLTPSRELARQVDRDANLKLLDQHELKKLWVLTDPPQNFCIEWRTEERWSGPISVGLLFLPGLPLWFFWDPIHDWSGGYGEIMAAVVIALQTASLLCLRPLVMRRIHDLALWFETRRQKRPSSQTNYDNPALLGLLESIRDMQEARLRKLAMMGAELAVLDREQNLRTALKRIREHRGDKKESEIRFFLVDQSIPALETEPGSLLLLCPDGSWREIVPHEVLTGEGSREVSEEAFVSVVAHLGAKLPLLP